MNEINRTTAQWFCQHKGRIIGPLSDQDLRQGVAKGHVTPDSLVRKGADGQWVKASSIRGLFVRDTRTWADDPPPSHTPSRSSAQTMSNSSSLSLDDLLGPALAASSAAQPLSAPIKSSYRTLQARKARKRVILASVIIVLLFTSVIVLGVAANYVKKYIAEVTRDPTPEEAAVSGWVEGICKEGRFAAMFPEQPKETDHGNGVSLSWRPPKKGYAFMVAFYRPQKNSDGTVETPLVQLERLRRESIEVFKNEHDGNLNGRSEVEITLHGVKGFKAEMRGMSNGGRFGDGNSYFFATDRGVYELASAWKTQPTAAIRAAEQKFFDSFRFLDQPGR